MRKKEREYDYNSIDEMEMLMYNHHIDYKDDYAESKTKKKEDEEENETIEEELVSDISPYDYTSDDDNSEDLYDNFD